MERCEWCRAWGHVPTQIVSYNVAPQTNVWLCAAANGPTCINEYREAQKAKQGAAHAQTHV